MKTIETIEFCNLLTPTLQPCGSRPITYEVQLYTYNDEKISGLIYPVLSESANPQLQYFLLSNHPDLAGNSEGKTHWNLRHDTEHYAFSWYLGREYPLTIEEIPDVIERMDYRPLDQTTTLKQIKGKIYET